MDAASYVEYLSDWCPPSVQVSQGMDGIRFELPHPSWSRRAGGFSIFTIVSVVLSFGFFFLLAAAAQMSMSVFSVLSPFIVLLGLVVSFSIMSMMRRLKKWRDARLPRVGVLITPILVEVTFKKQIQRVYISSIPMDDEGTPSFWHALQRPAHKQLTCQEQDVRSWLTETIDEWILTHRSRQGSREDVPVEIRKLRPSAALKR